MAPNSIGLKDERDFVQTTVLIWNPSYWYVDTVNENDHHHL